MNLPKNETPEPIKSGFKEINPAQDFLDNYSIVSVGHIELGEIKPQKKALLLRSDGKSFRLDKRNEELTKENLYTDRFPQPNASWSAKGLSDFKSQTKGLPEVSFVQVFQNLVETGQHYIDFEDKRIYSLMACWVTGTYFHRMFSSFPYLHFNGNKACGKTKTLQYLCHSAFNAEMSANNTPAYLIRVVHHNSSTLLLDEVENLSKPKDDDGRTIFNILNAGYKKGAFVGKTEQSGKDQTWTPMKFDAYSPKAFAGIQGLDPTLASRCIPVVMVNSSNMEILNREINDVDPGWQQIKDSLYRLLLEQFKPLRHSYNQITDTELVGREWELWKPILAVAQQVNPETYQELRALAIETQLQKQDNNLEDTDTPKILAAVEELLVTKMDDPFCSFTEIVDKLIESDEETFGWMKERKHKPSRWVSRQLKLAGVAKGKSIGKRVLSVMAKGYEFDVELVQKRLGTFRRAGFSVSTEKFLPIVSQESAETKMQPNETKPLEDLVAVETTKTTPFTAVQPGNQETHPTP